MIKSVYLKRPLHRIVVMSLCLFGAGLTLSTSLAPVAVAQSSQTKAIVEQAKASGSVGEQANGYLGLVTGSASASVQAAVNEINIRRKSVYTNLARTQNVSVNIVTNLSGEKLIGKAQAGQKIRTANGTWIDK